MTMTEQQLWEREARNHAELSTEYAEAVTEIVGPSPLIDWYKTLSGTHEQISKHFAQKAGHYAVWGWA